MTKLITAAAFAVALVAGGAAPALAASGDPQRPGGDVVPTLTSVNGGDHGWGNCGHNSSGGIPPSDPTAGGNGGFGPSDCVAIVPTDATL
jgi:hypothetical protein